MGLVSRPRVRFSAVAAGVAEGDGLERDDGPSRRKHRVSEAATQVVVSDRPHSTTSLPAQRRVYQEASLGCSGPLDLCSEAEFASAPRSDTPRIIRVEALSAEDLSTEGSKLICATCCGPQHRLIFGGCPVVLL